jgi:anaerobic selenocysteine-containing dehydrogenase
MLEAITGNIDRKGGNVFLPFPRLTPVASVPKIKRLSADRYPLFPSVPFPSFADAVFTGKPYMPKAIIINHSNTFLIDADSNKTKETFKNLDLIVVCDIFRTATTELAHVLLPEASPFERYGFRGYASHDGGFIVLRRKVIDPIGETRTMFEVEYEIARRMGLERDFPFTNNKEWISHRLKASNITFEDLDKNHIIYATPPMKYNKYLTDGFNTPSGKVELYSQTLKKAGYPPLPKHKDLDNAFPFDKSSIDKFPLIGTTRRSQVYTHTQFRNIPELRDKEPECLLRINPLDALKLGIIDGDMTRVKNQTGEIGIKASLTDEVKEGVVLIDFGWGNPGDGGVNVNLLTSDKDRDPISCSTSNHRFRCQVLKKF